MQSSLYENIELIRRNLNKKNHTVNTFKALLAKNNIDLKITISSASFWECSYHFPEDEMLGEINLSIRAIFRNDNEISTDDLETSFSFRVRYESQIYSESLLDQVFQEIVDRIKKGVLR